WIGRPLAASRLFAGIEDALSLAREAIRELPDNRRTQFITEHELDSALDGLGVALGHDDSLPKGLPVQLMDLAHLAATVVDIAQTLAAERGDENGVEMLFWALAAQRSIDSHRRDVTQTAAIAQTLNQRLAALESTARSMAEAMEFGFLFDQNRKLLSIGFLVPEGKL